MTEPKKRTYEVQTTQPITLTPLACPESKHQHKEEWVMFTRDENLTEEQRSSTLNRLIDRLKKI